MESKKQGVLIVVALVILLILMILILFTPSVSSFNNSEKRVYGMVFLEGKSSPPTYNHYLYEPIKQCESEGKWWAKNTGSTAYGYCQFLDGTWQYVQDKWEMVLIRDSQVHQSYACRRLLEEEGTRHWLESEHCWSK